MNAAKQKAALATAVAAEISELDRRMALYTARLGADPARALERAEAMFETAAKLEVLREINKGCESDKATYASIRAYAMNRAKHYATNRPSSTSTLANLIDDYRRVEWCRMAFDALYGLLAEEPAP